jgi:hypothetical protein
MNSLSSALDAVVRRTIMVAIVVSTRIVAQAIRDPVVAATPLQNSARKLVNPLPRFVTEIGRCG